MTRAQHHRLIWTGFSLVYGAGVGSLISWTSPFLDGFRFGVIVGFMLPVGVIGAASIAVAKSSEIDSA
jgi:hypothetical protein